ncbi:DUF6364 family protein [Cyclobacterium plantarum]|uniref:DUF6364 family protein n=1 Tax=Cyclobacterium plantarum TaxID=2716263 RepID=UPI003F6FFAC2
MKKRLNISVKEDLIQKIKKYTALQWTSISNLVEEHFEQLLKQPSRFPKEMSLVEFVKNLPKSKVDFPTDFDFKRGYFKVKSKA